MVATTQKVAQMKITFALAGLVILGFCGCKTRPQNADTRHPIPAVTNAITQVLIHKQRCGTDCARILMDSGKIANVSIYGWQYCSALKNIELQGCPEEFRQAWSDYMAAWNHKLSQEHATRDTLDAVSMWKGNWDDLPATVRSIDPYDTAAAWQHCEQVAAEYGAATPK